MKRNIILAIGLVSLLIVACAKKDVSTNETVAAGIVAQTESTSEVELAHPFVTVDNLEEAAKIAGFSIKLPDNIDGYNRILIEAMDKSIIQTVYQGEEQEISIRKALGTEDKLAGDYTEYPMTSEVTLSNNTVVTIKGEDEHINLAYWKKNGYTYAIYASGLSLEEVTKLAEEIE